MSLSRHASLLLVTVFASGCGGGAVIAPEAALDERTGTTVSHLNAPLQLLATGSGAPNGDPFAFAAPFETNRMGHRQMYFWVAVPGEAGQTGAPQLMLGDSALTLPASSGAAAALGLDALPYAAPAPWSKTFVYLLDEAALRRLEAARQISISIRYEHAGTIQFAGAWDGGGAIAAFRRSLGLAD